MSTGGKRRRDAVARHELDRIERAPVARDAAVGARAAIHYSKAKRGTCRRACAAQIGDGRKAAMQLEEARIVGRRVVLRGRPDQSSRVVHGALALPRIIQWNEARDFHRRPTALRKANDRTRSQPAQKWLNEGCANTSGSPSAPRKRASPALSRPRRSRVTDHASRRMLAGAMPRPCRPARMPRLRSRRRR